MKTTANLATFPEREQYLKIVINSIINQFDEVRVCLNEYKSIPSWLPKNVTAVIPNNDLTDNGKFMFLQPNEIYCTLDDDIIYPANYRQTIEKHIKANPNYISTFHGRILAHNQSRYYQNANHKTFHCVNQLDTPTLLHVCGTGVSGFNTNYFFPNEIAHHPLQKMSDLLCSLFAAQNDIGIICQPHKANWFQVLDVPRTIYNEKKNDDKIQAMLANRITRLPLFQLHQLD